MNSNVELGHPFGPDCAKTESSGMRTFFTSFILGFRPHLPLYLVALVTFIIGVISASKTGVILSFSSGKDLISYMFYLAVFCVSTGSAWHVYLFWKSGNNGSLIHEIIDYFKDVFLAKSRVINGLHVLISFTFLAAGFAALKPSISYLHSFSYDLDFYLLDKALHFGRSPHEWLSVLLDHPLIIFIINLNYNLWYYFMLFSLMFAGCSTTNSTLRMQFLLTYFLIWVLLGFVVAVIFSSAGPCYFELLGFGSEYVPLMSRLEAIDANHYPVWALFGQEMLWEGYMGSPEGALGISAFPSLHVAIATLLALGAWQINRLLGWVAVVYLLVIVIGSVILGWHYAVDGYASIILTILIWKTVGKFTDKLNLKSTEVETARPVQG